jgi:WD40 repeat protein
MDGHMNRVFALQYHPTDPNLLISGGWDDTVQFWDIRVSQSIRKISGPHICGNALDIEPGSFNIATGSWRYQSPLEVSNLISHNQTTLFTVLQECGLAP